MIYYEDVLVKHMDFVGKNVIEIRESGRNKEADCGKQSSCWLLFSSSHGCNNNRLHDIALGFIMHIRSTNKM